MKNLTNMKGERTMTIIRERFTTSDLWLNSQRQRREEIIQKQEMLDANLKRVMHDVEDRLRPLPKEVQDERSRTYSFLMIHLDEMYIKAESLLRDDRKYKSHLRGGKSDYIGIAMNRIAWADYEEDNNYHHSGEYTLRRKVSFDYAKLLDDDAVDALVTRVVGEIQKMLQDYGKFFSRVENRKRRENEIHQKRKERAVNLKNALGASGLWIDDEKKQIHIQFGRLRFLVTDDMKLRHIWVEDGGEVNLDVRTIKKTVSTILGFE